MIFMVHCIEYFIMLPFAIELSNFDVYICEMKLIISGCVRRVVCLQFLQFAISSWQSMYGLIIIGSIDHSFSFHWNKFGYI